MKKPIYCLTLCALFVASICSPSTSLAVAPDKIQRRDIRVTSWASVPAILARIKPPKFPARDFNITNFGAVADGKSDSTEAIRRTIAACNAAGGGRVVVPAGVFLTGAIHLQSNVNLYLSEGATLKFSTDPGKYLPVVYTRFEGTECMNYSPLIYAFEQENIAITGSGTLDGSAAEENWVGVDTTSRQ
jgi:polygalacturonase